MQELDPKAVLAKVGGLQSREVSFLTINAKLGINATQRP